MSENLANDTSDEAAEVQTEAAPDDTKPASDMDRAIEELSGMPTATLPDNLKPKSDTEAPAKSTDHILGIPVDVNVVLGTTKLSIARLMSLKSGEVVELQQQVGDALDIVVNEKVIAKGRITLMEDDERRFGIEVTELTGH